MIRMILQYSLLERCVSTTLTQQSNPLDHRSLNMLGGRAGLLENSKRDLTIGFCPVSCLRGTPWYVGRIWDSFREGDNQPI